MSTQPSYFPIFKSLQRGGLSLWLNRRSLLPLTMLPILVTFVTLALMRVYAPEDVSHFTLALMQLPADFAIGLFCALIIAIIMSAPKKDEKSGPMMFSLNLNEKRRILVAGAMAHTIFSYLYLGSFALTDMVAEPLRIAADNQEAVRMDLTILVIVLLLAGLYAVRFALLPVLVVGEMNIKGFYKKFKGFGFSFPVFFVKVVCMMAVGFLLVMPFSLGMTEGQEMSIEQGILLDFASACSAILSHAWAYATLAVGVRIMTDDF